MNCSTRTRGGVLIVDLHARWPRDAGEYPGLLTALDAAVAGTPGGVIVKICDEQAIRSALQLGVLVNVFRKAQARGQAPLVVVSAASEIHRIFDITGLKGLFTVCESEEQALKDVFGRPASTEPF